MTRTREWIYAWLLLAPAMILLVLFTHYPAVANLWHSFLSTPKGSRPAVWVGADNYVQLVEDPIAGVRFPRYAAAAKVEWSGKTYYFIGDQTRREFEAKQGITSG